MTTFLFWNLNKKSLEQEVVQLCKEYEVDALILAEVKFPEADLQIELNKGTGHVYIAPHNTVPNQLSSQLHLFSKYSQNSIRRISDQYGVSIREIQPPIGQSILLVAVHLNSKLNATDDEQAFQARQTAQTIEEAEKIVGHSRTVVMGDFNMSPFEGGMIDADAFHGVMSQDIVKKWTRIVRKNTRNFFYNPMWSRMGDLSDGPPGTYYYRRSRNRELFWYTFDQILIRPDLLTYFDKENLRIIEEIDGKSLLKSARINNSAYSDHLPIVMTLPVENKET